MSRCLTASRMKRGTKSPALQQAPKEGTQLRSLYDLLMASKGLPLELPLTTMLPRSVGIEQLRSFYGLDIRKLGYSRWVLAGEWFGRVYVDYIAERIEASRHQSPNPAYSAPRV